MAAFSNLKVPKVCHFKGEKSLSFRYSYKAIKIYL